MWRFVLRCAVVVLFAAICDENARGAPVGLPADYNNDGVVSHADYSLMADHFGQGFGIQNEGATLGQITQEDFDFYVPRYDSKGSSIAVGSLPLSVVITPVSGNLLWTFTFSNLNGALAGHLNITTNGPNILSVGEGTSFRDDNDGGLEAPGFNNANVITQGIQSSGSNDAFAALGTNLTTSPALLNSNSTLEFLHLTTAGMQPTTLTFFGNYGYQNHDYSIGSSASSVPEPTSGILMSIGMLLSGSLRFTRRRGLQ